VEKEPAGGAVQVTEKEASRQASQWPSVPVSSGVSRTAIMVALLLPVIVAVAWQEDQCSERQAGRRQASQCQKCGGRCTQTAGRKAVQAHEGRRSHGRGGSRV